MKLVEQIDWPPPGRYAVALSGGVDSVVLLDCLAQRLDPQMLTAVYVDHGWRDTAADQAVVNGLTRRLGVGLRVARLALKGRGEAEARRARYAALEGVRREVSAAAIITAHHLDDQLETVALNLLRGTGRQGLSGLRSHGRLLRPLLAVPKRELLAYAREHKLAWSEDPTNTDTRYRRNWVRHDVLTRRPVLQRELQAGMVSATELNDRIDRLLAERLGGAAQQNDHELMVPWERLAELSLTVLQEALIYLGRRLDPAAEFEFRSVEQLARDLKTGQIRGPRRLSQRLFIRSQRDTVAIEFKAP
jgi:tRNA(Ile)-lysidine synthase